MISNERFINWMNIVRATHGPLQYRILENFWESQISSKQWLLDTLKNLNISCNGVVYIFGGWFGVLGGMLKDTHPNIKEVFSIDIDQESKSIGSQLNPDLTFITCDMQNINFSVPPSLVINTSTEHITQAVFDNWIKKIPSKVPIILQGNNFFSCVEHIRCSINLQEFQKMNSLDVIKYAGELDCRQFTRYMTIGYKNG